MNTEPTPETPRSAEELLDLANEQLKTVLQNLKEAKRVLARDWEQMSPRERSAYARQVKVWEERQKTLLEEIEIHSATL
jgi:hypothetical protein